MDQRGDLAAEFGGKSFFMRHVHGSEAGAPPVAAAQGPVAALANACKAAEQMSLANPRLTHRAHRIATISGAAGSPDSPGPAGEATLPRGGPRWPGRGHTERLRSCI